MRLCKHPTVASYSTVCSNVLSHHDIHMLLIMNYFALTRDTILFMARDGSQYSISKDRVRDMSTVHFPLRATIAQGEIVGYSYLASVTSEENEHYNAQYNSSARYNIPSKECMSLVRPCIIILDCALL